MDDASLTPPRSRDPRPWFSLALTYLPLWTAVIAGIWGLWTYLEGDRQARVATADLAAKESRTRLIEAQKPFLDNQLKVYFETAAVVGKLVTLAPNEPQWNEARIRFEELYWSELTMVEHLVVATAMKGFRDVLVAFEKAPTSEHLDDLKRGALGVADALRAGIKQSWGDPSSNIVAP